MEARMTRIVVATMKILKNSAIRSTTNILAKRCPGDAGDIKPGQAAERGAEAGDAQIGQLLLWQAREREIHDQNEASQQVNKISGQQQQEVGGGHGERKGHRSSRRDRVRGMSCDERAIGGVCRESQPHSSRLTRHPFVRPAILE